MNLINLLCLVYIRKLTRYEEQMDSFSSYICDYSIHPLRTASPFSHGFSTQQQQKPYCRSVPDIFISAICVTSEKKFSTILSFTLHSR